MEDVSVMYFGGDYRVNKHEIALIEIMIYINGN